MSRTLGYCLGFGFALSLLLPAGAMAQTQSYRFTASESRDGRIDLALHRNANSRNNRGWDRGMLQGLTAFAAGAPLHFRIVREAGTLDCEGKGTSSSRGEGECRFERAPAYFDG